MDSTPKDNPASRLLALIAAARELPPNIQIVNAWRQLLGISDASLCDLLVRLGPIFALPGEVRVALEAVVEAEDAPQYLAWLSPVEGAFSILRFDANWGEVQGPLQDARVMSLKFCEIELKRHSLRPGLRDASLADLSERINQLEEALAEATDLPTDLRDFIEKRLWEIRRAVHEARFRGPAGLEAAVSTAVGGIGLRPRFLARLRANKAGTKFVDLLRIVATLVNITHDTLEIADSEFLQLEPGVIEEQNEQPPDLPPDTRRT